jgi:hypothetical protein
MLGIILFQNVALNLIGNARGQRSSMKVGDTISLPTRDRRSWWQRIAPLFLGGKPKEPQRQDFVIVDEIKFNRPRLDG